MNTTNIPYFEDEDSRLKPDLPIVERETVNVIVHNPAKDQVLCLEWEKFNWKTFIIGGVDNNEDSASAALREIKEETGYKNLELICEIGKLRSGYYAAHKNENRIANTTGFLFKLLNEDQDKVDESEVTNHVFKWIPKNNVESFVNLSSQKYLWTKALEYLK